MGEKLQALPVGELRKIAKENGIKSVTTLRKQQLIDMILEVTEKKEEKEERDVPLYCSITVACSICSTLSDTQYKGEGK